MTNVWLPPMNASDVMTKNVVTVSPEAPTRTVAKLLLENGFSAVPVTPVEAIAETLQARNIKRVPVVRDGRVVGIVSRADLVRALAKFHKAGPAVGAR